MINHRRDPLRLLLTAPQWKGGLGVSIAAAALAAVFSYEISLWIPLVIFVLAFTVFHLPHAAHFLVPLPHIAILISGLQYVVAAWLSYYVPSSNPVLNAAANLPFYMSYGGPVVIAVSLGWAASLLRLSPRRLKETGDAGLLLELDLLLAAGLLATVASRFLQSPGLAFVLVLISNLRYVGVFGRMVIAAPGWKRRLAVVLVAEVIFAAEAAMFHPLLMWSSWAFAIWLYCYQPSKRTIFSCLAVAAFLLPALQQSKWKLRGSLDEDPAFHGLAVDVGEEAAYSRAFSWLGYLAESVVDTATGQLSYEFLSDTATRYNQGWLITNVMLFVPEMEPYARGETLKDAARAALLPRVLDPNKLRAGGREKMSRFAGMELNEGTSMNLGYAGEMYANFGPYGGVVGCGIYALFFGMIFRFLCRRAFEAPLLWCVVPYIFFSALKAEDGIGEVLNWTVKSCLVVGVVFILLPNFRRLLLSRSRKVPLTPIYPGNPQTALRGGSTSGEVL